MDYKKTGTEIFKSVGGNDNVTQMTHCATRLRFELKDNTSIDKTKIKKIAGVLDVIEKGGQLQVVIGQEVATAYKAANELFDQHASKAVMKEEKKSLFDRFSSMMLGIFNPIVPAIMAAGMVKAILALLKAFGWIDVDGSTYYFLNFISDAAFYFMPMTLAYATAKYFKTSIPLALTLAGVLLHPNFAALVTANEPVSFLGFNVPLASYGTSVFPIILIVIVMSYVEKVADNYIPTMIKFVFKPLLIVGVTAPLALLLIGPIGYYAGLLLGQGITWIDSYAGWLVPTILGGLFPLLVMTGMHGGTTPIVTQQLAAMGHETVNGPGMLAANIAQAGAALAVAFKAKKYPNMRQNAITSGVSALMGITEPAMYGVNLPLKKPFAAVIIAGVCGGFFAGITGLVRYSFGAPGLPTLPVFIGDDPMNLMKAIGTMGISFTVAFLITLLMKIEFVEEESEDREAAIDFIPKKIKETITVYSPLKGKVVSLAEVPDSVFAKEVLGKGVAILPEKGEVAAPFEGQVVSLFPSNHAIGLIDKHGCEVLIHVGMDTVELNGKYFKALVSQGDKVVLGQPLLRFDLDALVQEGYTIITPIVITNTTQFDSIEAIAEIEVDVSDNLLRIN